MESKLKHLEFIQGVITRMNSNSFRLKGWSVVVVSALLLLIARGDDSNFAYMGLLAPALFWSLDAYYLAQERLYRKLYDSVRTRNPDDIDFSMNTTGLGDRGTSWRRVMVSRTIIWFYVTMILAMLTATSIH